MDDWSVGGIIDRLGAEIPRGERLKDVAVGLFWTLARGARTTLAATPIGWEEVQGPWFGDPGDFLERDLHDLIEQGRKGTWFERALALAAIHACISGVCEPTSEEDGADLLVRVAKGREISLVGHFPFVSRLREAGHKISVYELAHRCQPGDRPIEELLESGVQEGVLAITSATLIGGGLSGLLRCAAEDVPRIVIGPSAPLHPILWSLGIDALCGTLVEEPSLVTRFVIQGAIHRQIPGLKKVTVIRPGGRLEGFDA